MLYKAPIENKITQIFLGEMQRCHRSKLDIACSPTTFFHLFFRCRFILGSRVTYKSPRIYHSRCPHALLTLDDRQSSGTSHAAIGVYHFLSGFFRILSYFTGFANLAQSL